MKAKFLFFNLATIVLLLCTVSFERTTDVDFEAIGARAEAPLDNDDESGACDGIKDGNAAFSPGSAKIPGAAAAALDALSQQMSYSPSCRVVVSGHGGGSKADQQLSWNRVNAVIEYMSDKNNIDRNRFIFDYQSAAAGTDNIVFRAAREGEDGPASVPAPYPDLRR